MGCGILYKIKILMYFSLWSWLCVSVIFVTELRVCATVCHCSNAIPNTDAHLQRALLHDRSKGVRPAPPPVLMSRSWGDSRPSNHYISRLGSTIELRKELARSPIKIWLTQFKFSILTQKEPFLHSVFCHNLIIANWGCSGQKFKVQTDPGICQMLNGKFPIKTNKKNFFNNSVL